MTIEELKGKLREINPNLNLRKENDDKIIYLNTWNMGQNPDSLYLDRIPIASLRTGLFITEGTKLSDSERFALRGVINKYLLDRVSSRLNETTASFNKWLGEMKKAGIKLNEQFREESNMKINIPIGTRDTVSNFWDSYARSFLEKYNFLTVSVITLADDTELRFLVKTKYGYIAVKYADHITYVGDGVWSVSHD